MTAAPTNAARHRQQDRQPQRELGADGDRAEGNTHERIRETDRPDARNRGVHHQPGNTASLGLHTMVGHVSTGQYLLGLRRLLDCVDAASGDAPHAQGCAHRR